MINYTKKNVLMITLTVTTLIYVVISVICFKLSIRMTNNTQDESTQMQITEENIQPNESEISKWQIQIPSINLYANIAEGTTSNVIAKYVGHFTKTSTLDGNIGLAAHNRGIGVESYFSNIKSLEIGDEIIYQKDNDIKKYKVTKNVIIDETDWTYLENTTDNRITLITCVENQPKFRRCIQGVEIT